MNYEIVNLGEIKITGLNAVTSNTDPNMGAVIGGLWEKLFQGVYEKIKYKANGYTVGLYSDYENDGYQVTVGAQVSKADTPELTTKTLPPSKYAKFSVQGPMRQAVAKAWQEIWEMDLDRSYTGDFEEYLDGEMENAHIHIYIALK